MQTVNPPEGLGKLRSLVGEQAVLLPLELGSKAPKENGWQKRTFEQTQESSYQKRLLEAIRRGGNIGVVLGPASGNLCTIDIDTDDEIEAFLALNPPLANSLRTRGANGCQIWVKIVGKYPARRVNSKLKIPGTDNKKSAAEWRGGGGHQSVIQGQHPDDGIFYRFMVEELAIEIAFDEIIWPERWGMSFDDGAHPCNGGTRDEETVELTPERRERVLRYLDTVDIAVSGQGGSDPTYRFANVLVWGFALSIEQARPFMLIYSAKCKPPWSMEEIEHKLADALKADHHGGKPRGHLWDEESDDSDDDDSTPASWIPQETLNAARDIDKPIIFVEGQTKGGEALLKAGAFPIGLQGLRLKLRTELASFEWQYRRVFLCLQPQGKKDRWLEIRAWILLRLAGAEVAQLASWPPVEGNWKEFLETLDHRDIDALKSELCRIKDRAKREELAGKVARKLKLPKGALIGDFQEPEKGEPDSNGARPVKISPTSEPWAEKVKVDEVLDEICAAQARFLWMKPSQRRAVALAIVLTYLHDIVDVLPILLVTSPEEECGKSTLLKFILFLSNRPLPASNISASAIFRTIEAHCPTLILDEADSYLQENEEMRGVINSGHEREFAYVIRTVSLPNGELATAEFSTWCPKAIAQIGLPKRTILSRSVHIRLGRKPKNVKTEKLRKKHYEEFGDLRRKISRLANDIRDHVKTFENDSLDNRAGDNWGPLFAIASGAGEEWLEKTMLAARRMSQKDAQEMKSFGRYLLESLDRIIVAKREKLELPPTENIFLRSLDLVNELNQDDEAPWKDGKSGELNTRQLSTALGKFEITSKQVKEGPVRGRGYWSDDIEKEIQKYARSGI